MGTFWLHGVSPQDAHSWSSHNSRGRCKERMVRACRKAPFPALHIIQSNGVTMATRLRGPSKLDMLPFHVQDMERNAKTLLFQIQILPYSVQLVSPWTPADPSQTANHTEQGSAISDRLVYYLRPSFWLVLGGVRLLRQSRRLLL